MDKTTFREEIQNEKHNGEVIRVNDPILPGLLHQALITGDFGAVRKMAKENSPVQLADSLNLLSDNECVEFYSLSNDLPNLGEVFSYLSVEERVAICNNVPRKQLIQVLSYVRDDDLADFLEDVKKEVRQKVMALLPSKRKKVIDSLASYGDGTVGSIMTTEFLSVLSGSTIQDVFDLIKAHGKEKETVRTVFVVDGTTTLLGIKRLEELMFLDPKAVIDTVMDKDFAYISPVADQEAVISLCQKYNLAVLPVVIKTGEIVGILTFDDVLDVVEEENTEDVLKQAGVTPTNTPYLETKPYKMALSYVIWLIVIALINTFSSLVLSGFEPILERLSFLVVFLPALNDTGGNSGDQTTSTITRSLATGDVTLKDYLKVLGKESVVGILSALLVATFNFGWVQVEFHAHLISLGDAAKTQMITDFGSLNKAYLIVGLVVSLSLAFAIFFSKIMGASLPMLAKLLHIDPAVVSGPLISCLMDILTMIIYFLVAKSIITGIDPHAFDPVSIAIADLAVIG